MTILLLHIWMNTMKRKNEMDYNRFNKWYETIWDDMFNFFLIINKCKELYLSVDSCYSGRFNDILSKIVITI